jgi:hydrogenase nickel incorporation protein HypB
MDALLRRNDDVARGLRDAWTRCGTLAVNLLSGPGSGKTALLEASLPLLAERHRVLVLEGDLETDRDARRIHRAGADVVAITTGGTCHLEAGLVERAWGAAPGGPYDIVFIENVGNLVCPASYDLGEHLRVVLLSAPEGDDKPAKYPKAFRTAHAFAVTKIDLLPHFDFSVERARREALEIQPRLEVFALSARTGEGIDAWVRYVERAAAERIAIPR